MSVDFHFLNAGSGDCTIVYFPPRTLGQTKLDERIMMVDLCSHTDHEAYEDVLSYYKDNFKNSDGTVKPIFRFICTHPHHDHICGLKAFLEDNDIKVLNFWDLEHSFKPATFDGHPTHEEDWKSYRALGGNSSTATVLHVTRETTPGQFWDDHGDRITVLSPSAALIKHAHYKEDGSKRDPSVVEIDEMSYAIAVRVNDRSVILAGDGRATPAWDDIYANCKDTLKSCYILKAGHHGHDCSFHEEAVKLMAPVMIVLSNSEEENKANGAEKKYSGTCPNAKIYRTWEGSVVVKVPFDSTAVITVNR